MRILAALFASMVLASVTAANPVVKLETPGNVLVGRSVRSSSTQLTFVASQAVDGLIRSDANGDNGLFFANDDADQRLAVTVARGPIREIRIVSNGGDPPRLPRSVSVRATSRAPVDSNSPSLDSSAYESALFDGVLRFDRPAGEPADDQIVYAALAVDAPANTKALLFDFGKAAGSGERVSEVQAFAERLPRFAPNAPMSRVVLSDDKSRIVSLGWDTEKGERSLVNLLRRQGAVILQPAGKIAVTSVDGGGFDLAITGGPGKLTFPFSPTVAATTVLPSRVDDNGTFHLPAIVSAPGYGQMLVTGPAGVDVPSHLVGSRGNKTVDWFVDVPTNSFTLSFRPVRLAPPAGLHDDKRWAQVRRAWFNVFQVTAAWGDAGNPFSAPPGVLGNNVISDPVSCCLFMYADSALWTPELAPGVSAMAIVGHTLDWWIDKRVAPTGEVPGYWNYLNFLDANPSLLISAWDYVEATQDEAWLRARIAKLEKLAEFLASRDVDHDGILEAVQSGNANTLIEPARSCSAMDAINCGHKDAYCNALAYRAFRCLAELEDRLGRREQGDRYWQLADKLKAAFAPTFFDAKSGLMILWQSRDGQRHGYEPPIVNGYAVQFGLVDGEQAKSIVLKLRERMRERGFKRFDLGVPLTLLPVRPADYLQPNAPGLAKREDGSDTFGWYLNGGVISGDALRYIAACYTVGETTLGDETLDAMLARVDQGDLAAGGFPLGVVDQYPLGGEFWTWDGQTCGYEGLLSHAYHFVQAVPLRDPQLRARMMRPIQQRWKHASS